MRGIKDTVLNAMVATVTIVATIAGVRYFLPGAERDFNEKQLAAAELVDNWETYSAAGKRIGSQSPPGGHLKFPHPWPGQIPPP